MNRPNDLSIPPNAASEGYQRQHTLKGDERRSRLITLTIQPPSQSADYAAHRRSVDETCSFPAQRGFRGPGRTRNPRAAMGARRHVDVHRECCGLRRSSHQKPSSGRISGPDLAVMAGRRGAFGQVRSGRHAADCDGQRRRRREQPRSSPRRHRPRRATETLAECGRGDIGVDRAGIGRARTDQPRW